MRARRLVTAIALACAASAPAACRDASMDARAAADVAAAAPRPADGAVVVDDRMMASIKVDAIAERDLTNELVVAGKVQFDEDRVSRVLVPVPGQVVDLRVKVGDPVKKGQTLCAISSREAAAAVGEHIEARRDLELAEKNAAMTEDLYNHEAASRIALQQAQNDLAKARARVARTEEALRVLGLAPKMDLPSFNGRVPIVAPISGVVIDRKVTEGQFVQTDATPIITLADLSNVWVVGDVFERDLRLVGRGQAATIATAAYPGEKFRGVVDYISEAIDPVTRSAKVRVTSANVGGRLKPEMFATIALDVATHERAVSIPSRAVLTENGRTFVYVQVAPRRFVRRGVEVDQGAGDERRILAGLRPGERVVTDGAILLRQEEEQRAG
jgi:cobalt-zinc-cadmium efflux system membrane fusion protein